MNPKYILKLFFGLSFFVPLLASEVELATRAQSITTKDVFSLKPGALYSVRDDSFFLWAHSMTSRSILANVIYLLDFEKKRFVLQKTADADHYEAYNFSLPSLKFTQYVKKGDWGWGYPIGEAGLIKSKKKTTLVHEEYYFISKDLLLLYEKSLIEKTSVVRLVFYPDTEEELSLSRTANSEWKKWLHRIISQGKIQSDKDSSNAVLVELQLEISKSKRLIICFWISPEKLPQEIHFIPILSNEM